MLPAPLARVSTVKGSGTPAPLLGTDFNLMADAVDQLNIWTSAQFSVLSRYPNVDYTGATDSTAAVTAWLASIAGTNVTGLWDCPVLVDIGIDPTRPIFLRSDTKVVFSGKGKCILTNSQLPGYVLMGITNVFWENAWFEWIGTNAIDYTAAPYTNVAANFNNNQLKTWMAGSATGSPYNSNPVIFSGAGATPYWLGPLKNCPILMIRGGCSNVRFRNTRFTIPKAATLDKYILSAVMLDVQWKPGQTVTNATVPVSTNVDAVNDVTFTNTLFDGVCMGVSGGAIAMSFFDTESLRYGDLFDAAGNNGGGVGTWMAPPHLFYVANPIAGIDGTLVINGTTDRGYWGGPPTRRPVSSGFCNSLKIDSGSAFVNGYMSQRPDGWADITSVGNSRGEITNVYVEMDTTCVNSAGGSAFAIRFPSSPPLKLFSLNNCKVFDTAAVPSAYPIQNASQYGNQDVTIEGLEVTQNDYQGTYVPGFMLAGTRCKVKYKNTLLACNSTQGFRGGLQFSGSPILQNSSMVVEEYGWRQATVNFTTPLSIAATGGTVTSWAFATGTYPIIFDDGEIRLVALTLNAGSQVVAWALPLTAAVGAVANTQVLTNNFEAFKQRIVLNFNIGSVGVYAKMIDAANGCVTEIINGVMKETWNQNVTINTTAVSSIDTFLKYPAGFAIDSVVVSVVAAPGQTFNIGWTGNLSALNPGGAAVPNTVANTPHPQTSPITVSADAHILFTTTSGVFNTTGQIILALSATRVSISG